MKQIEELVFPLVEAHFPDFYRDEGPRFVSFVKEYYRWMESEGEALNASRNLLDYRNIDATSPDFVKYFTNKYLAGVPLSSEANSQFLIKHASDIYRSKGTERGVQLLIQGLFNEEATVTFPGEDIFKSSDGTWVKPIYLELTVSERTQAFVGKEIVGSRSGAKAFLESLVTRRIAGKYQQVAYLSNVRGRFETGELITTTADTTFEDAPTVIGSMTSLTVLDGGAEFSVGDIFNVSSSNGKQGKARVTEVSNETGKVSFIYINALTSGGWGYSLSHANVIVSEKVLTLTSIINGNGSINTFSQFETVTQPLTNIAYISAKGNNFFFDAGAVVENYAANGSVVANATIAVSNKTTNTTGYLIVVPNVGNIAAQDTTFAIRSEDPDVSSFNASLVGFAYNTFTASYSKVYTGAYTGSFTNYFSNIYTGNFSGAYGNLYTATYGGTYTGAWTASFASGSFSGAYSSTYGGSFSRIFSRIFTTSGISNFTRNFVGRYGSVPYSGLAYTGAYTGTYTTAGFLGLYVNSYTGAYAPSATNYVHPYTGVSYAGPAPFTKAFTGSAAPGTFVGSYQGTYAGAYVSHFTGSRVSPFNGVAYVGYYAGYFTGSFVGSYQGTYPGSYVNPYTGVSYGVFTGAFNVKEYISAVYTTTYSGSYLNYPVFTGTASPYTGGVSYFVGQGFTGAYLQTFTGNYTGTFTSAYTSTYAGTYNLGTTFSSVYTNSYTSAWTGAYSAVYVGNYSSTFTNEWTGTFSQVFTGDYTKVFTSQYTGLYNVFSGTYNNLYTGTFNASYSRTFTGGFSRTFTGTFTGVYGAFTGGYSRLFTGTFNQSFTGAFTPTFTGVFNQSFSGSYNTIYTGFFTTTFTGSGSFTGAFAPSFSGTYNSFTGAYTRDAYTKAFAGLFTGSFTSTYTPSFTGGFTASFTGVYGGFTGNYTLSYTGLYTSGGNRINTTEAHDFSNNDLVRYHVRSGNTAIPELQVGVAYYVVNTVQGSTSLYLSSTPSGATISMTRGSNETGHDLIKTYGTAVISGYADRTATGNTTGSNATYTSFSFNAQTDVSNTNDTVTISNHTFENNYVVRYSVATGNSAIDGLVSGRPYYVVNTTAATFQLATTRNGTPINISSSNRNENGHTFTYATGFLGVVDIGVNGFIGSPYTYIVGDVSNTYARVANVSTGTGAGFQVGLLTDTENVLLSPDFIESRNTGNVAFSGIMLNGRGSNVSAGGYGTNTTFNANTDVTGGTGGTGVLLPSSIYFNANTGVANTTEVITLLTKHPFSNNETVTYAVHPTNTAVSGLTNGSTYYVINTTPGSTTLQLSLTSGGAPINITAGLTQTGHSLTRAGVTGSNNTIAITTAIDFVPNTAVLYYTDSGNTAVGGLSNNTVYYIDQANATHVALKTSYTGSRVALTKGLTQTGHRLYGPLKILTGANSSYSNVGYNEPMFRGLGFVKFPGTSLDTILLDALRFDSTTIGSIASIVAVNPGSEYNVDPFVTVVDTFVVGYNARDYVMQVSNTVGAFVVGEQIQQSYSNPAIQLTVNTFSGTAANGISTSTFVINEFVYQGTSPATATASGFVQEAAIGAGSGSVKLINTTGTFVNTTGSSTLLKGLSSGSTSNVSAVTTTTYATTARALVKSANSSVLKLKRINLENTFLLNNVIIGRTSGTTANVVSIVEDANTIPVGLNAAIEANVQTANNVVKKLAVADSGFGYLDQETVTLTKEGSVFSVTAIVELGQQGVGAGYYSSTRGFVSDDKKLQDNEYYQEYSYEVQTKVPFDKYFDVLKQITHVAGTRAFGKVNTLSLANLAMTAINSIETSNT